MKIDRLIEVINATHNTMVELTNTKGSEYTNSDIDRLSNFKRIAVDLDLTSQEVLLVYLMKHMASIKTFVRDRSKGQNRALSEPINGRIDDAILYLILLKCLIEDGIRPEIQFT